DELEQRALARSVAADHAEGSSLRNREADIVERGERLVRPEARDEAAGQQRALQRGELLALAVPAVDLGCANHFDRGRHTSSANVSRSRSNIQYANRKKQTDPTPSATSHFQ